MQESKSINGSNLTNYLRNDNITESNTKREEN